MYNTNDLTKLYTAFQLLVAGLGHVQATFDFRDFMVYGLTTSLDRFADLVS
jgi:hypothetical protein